MTTLVQNPAPDFTAQAVMPDNTIEDNFRLEASNGMYRLLFFYPFDFSFVCPTELLALDESLEAFRERECEVVAVSTDSVFSHLAWKKTDLDDGGIGPVQFPLVSDLEKTISRRYGVLAGESVALRGTFLIDREGIVRHMSINDMDTGRSIREILRTLDAVRRFDETGKFCPAGWSEGGEEAPSGDPSSLGLKRNIQEFDLQRS
jgi:peroxiredoxin (alkyl hydroperoxide reductase subunit C)